MSLPVGARVTVVSKGAGIVRFCGPVKFAAGVWVGVQLDAASGDGNGTVDGVRYFACKPKFAVSIQPEFSLVTYLLTAVCFFFV